MQYSFSFSRYQTKCVIELFRQLMTSLTLRFFLRSSSKAIADRQKNKEGQKYKNYRNKEMQKSRERKEHFR